MPPETTLYPTKNLRYKICEFLIDKRRRTPGLGNALRIRGEEIAHLLEFAVTSNGNTREDAFVEELIHLEDEIFNKIKLITIENKEVLNNFTQWVNGGSVLKVRCNSKRLEDYISELKNRTRVAVRNLGLAEIKSLPSGGIEVFLGDKKIKFGKSKRGDLNLYSNIIELMHNGSVIVLGEKFTLSENYKKKDFVSFNDLTEIISTIKDDIDGDDNAVILKSIKDAVRNINTKSQEKLGRPLFKKENEGFVWAI